MNILIVGATSGIAEAVARRYAAEGANLFLVGRNGDKLQVIRRDLLSRGAKDVQFFTMDCNDINSLSKMMESAFSTLATVDVALIAHGTLPDQQRTESDLEYAMSEFRTNAESVIVCLSGLAARMAAQRKGTLAVIGSVAGDRGRASNYLYGSAKAAIDAFASGLRMRLYRHDVHVLVIKPGFVATAMTAKLNLPQRLTAMPETVAIDICKAISKRTDVLYTPWFWAWIMRIIRLVPTSIFKKLNF